MRPKSFYKISIKLIIKHTWFSVRPKSLLSSTRRPTVKYLFRENSVSNERTWSCENAVRGRFRCSVGLYDFGAKTKIIKFGRNNGHKKLQKMYHFCKFGKLRHTFCHLISYTVSERIGDTTPLGPEWGHWKIRF